MLIIRKRLKTQKLDFSHSRQNKPRLEYAIVEEFHTEFLFIFSNGPFRHYPKWQLRRPINANESFSEWQARQFHPDEIRQMGVSGKMIHLQRRIHQQLIYERDRQDEIRRHTSAARLEDEDVAD